RVPGRARPGPARGRRAAARARAHGHERPRARSRQHPCADASPARRAAAANRMPEHLRALVVIVLLAGLTFALARAPACAAAMKDQDFVHRRNLWFALTLAAFLAHNFWLFVVLAAALLLLAAQSERN